MRIIPAALAVLVLLSQTGRAQVDLGTAAGPQPIPEIQQVGAPGQGVYSITQAGPHQRRWARVTRITRPDGVSQAVTNSYVEIASGMNAWSPAQQRWIEASGQIEIRPGGPGQAAAAVARKAQHQVIFSPRLLQDPTVDFLLPDGKRRLQSRVAGIAYTDSNSGQSVWLAEARDTGAELVGGNQILYPAAFDGLDADIRYTMTICSFAQDILLSEQLPFPAELRQAGFTPESTRVEIWTSFVTDTPPDRHPILSDGKVVEGDEQLDFGPNSMAFGPSQAFKLDDSAAPQPDPLLLNQHGLRMAMEWAVINGEQFLIESMPFLEAQRLTQDLPKAQARAVSTKGLNPPLLAKGGKVRSKPVPLWAQSRPAPENGREVAQVKRRASYSPRRAVLWDYVLINGATDYRFKGDTTYYVTADAYFFGSTVLEGGTVIKFDRYLGTPGVPRIILRAGPMVCETSTYRPAVFTAKDDDSLGAIIDGSTGNPGTNYYGYTQLCLWDLGPACDVHDVRFCYAYAGFSDEWRQQSALSHVQFINCYQDVNVYQGAFQLRNALSCNAHYGLVGQYSTVSAENATFDTGYQLIYNVASSTFSLANCLIVAYANSSGYSGSCNQTVSSPEGVFEVGGGGAHYLPAGSPYRNAGTANINAGLLADLKTRTTVAPLLLSTNFTLPTTLGPCIARDADTPDLGYHYDPLDYLVSGLAVTNSSLLLTNGVAVGCSGAVGINLLAGSKLISEGSPTRLNRIAGYRTVQEGSTADPEPSSQSISCDSSYSPPPELYARFTEFSLLPSQNSAAHIVAPSSGGMLVTLRDSQFAGGALLADDSTGLSLEITDCLFLRVLSFIAGDSVTCYNSTFYGGSLSFSDAAGQTYTVQDNLFDRTVLENGSSGTWTVDHNGYVSGYSRLNPTSGTDVVLAASPAYQSGPLGAWYLPSSIGLINAGSRLASAAGLYHCTTQTNQTKEAATTVDIGFHYVASDLSGLALDSDGDGFPDDSEDANGNGVFDSAAGETDWQTSDSPVSGAAALQVFTPLE